MFAGSFGNLKFIQLEMTEMTVSPIALFNIRSVCRRVGRNAEYGDYCMQI